MFVNWFSDFIRLAKILQVRQLVHPFIWYHLGNGATTSAWFDNWCFVGPIEGVVSNQDIYSAGFWLNAKLSNTADRIIWRDHNNMDSEFSVAIVWDCIRPRNNDVDWFYVVWFSYQIPHHVVHLWLVIKRKLKTQDSLRQWDVWEHLKRFTGMANMPSALNLIIQEDDECADVDSSLEVTYLAYWSISELMTMLMDTEFSLVRVFGAGHKVECSSVAVLFFPSPRFFPLGFYWVGFLRRQDRLAVYTPIMLLRDDFEVLYVAVVFDTCKKVCIRLKWTSNGSLYSKDNYYIDRRVLWSNLVGHAGLMRNRPWVLLGDFNDALNLEDHSSGGYEPNIAMRDFRDCVQAMDVRLLISGRIHFTLNQKPKGSYGILKRLIELWDGFREIVESGWNVNIEFFAMYHVVKRLKGLKSHFYKLLHEHGNLHERVNRLRVELDEAQKAINMDPSSSMLHEEHAHYLLAFKEAQLDEERFLKIEMVSDASNMFYDGNQVPDAFVSHYNQFFGVEGDTTPLDVIRFKISIEPSKYFDLKVFTRLSYFCDHYFTTLIQ
ncbi:RNA-directed DNA polymerase, eukaryota, reverse transcriptase zinc-binding domain protein [Tanacetum coccineum]